MEAPQDGDLHVVIQLERPCKIVQASPQWLADFDFTAEECVGRTLALIQGPMTDPDGIEKVIEAARWGKQADKGITLYSRHRSCTVPWKVATAEDGLAKAVLDASDPCRVVHVSPELTTMYGLLPHEVLGRTLNILHGPSTDRRQWLALLEKGRRGLSARAVVMTWTRDMREVCTEATVTPVVQGVGSFVHLLLVFLPLSGPTRPGLGADVQQHAAQAAGLVGTGALLRPRLSVPVMLAHAMPVGDCARAVDGVGFGYLQRGDDEMGDAQMRLDDQHARQLMQAEPLPMDGVRQEEDFAQGRQGMSAQGAAVMCREGMAYEAPVAGVAWQVQIESKAHSGRPIYVYMYIYIYIYTILYIYIYMYIYIYI
jgi:hypothetical protein